MPFSNEEHVKYKRLLEIQKELEAAKKMNELTQNEVYEWINTKRREVLIDITSGSYTFVPRKGRTKQMNDNEYRLFQTKFQSDSSKLKKEHAEIVHKITDVSQKIESMRTALFPAQNRYSLFDLEDKRVLAANQEGLKARARGPW